MGKIKKYAAIILEILQHYDDPNNPIETHLITDLKRHYYQVLRMGWVDRDNLMMRIVLYLQIKPDGKIWILENWTEDEITDTLIEKGVPKTDIVLGLLPEYVRKDSGFAVA